MKKIWIVLALSPFGLFSCGGSQDGEAPETIKTNLVAELSNTSWIKECSLATLYSEEESTDIWNVKVKLGIDSSLKATYRTEYYRATDTSCDFMEFDTLDVSTFTIKGKVMSEESVEAYALDEAFIYHSDNRANSVNYTLIYLNSEKLYFGQSSGANLGETSETRHSSVSLDNYFMQIIN
ncbi:hypothetical protein [Colwellia sp. RSH04]|uniref:hypothetical protein n=1 Tax=Colwellia sp. RSH04 TaxID=2305464 RepID=UPI000E5760CA|nr:hypothetical protein [Colwellia sp. RSH04]RHW74679.1 hypothetical protein D1094_17565 [Colwellia sp. RSH04]